MASGRRNKRRMMGEINVVPYIDVMLVLLIIFMVTAPLLIQGVDVDLPSMDAEPIDPDELQDTQPITVTVDREGAYFISIGQGDDQQVDADQLLDIVAEALDERPDSPVYVRGDRNVNYGRVMEAMTMLRSAGAPSVGLITEPPGEVAGGEGA
ncbi:biopolymer transport protein TolR [Natronospira proteinivora]|uniref:Tol-Pal system protein TolR n=1 Tax=Natronospira proteinivora TaxID=1807133 RepID=A0ABT1G635_9GAMM|nr:protein TolR [Natronospira proteinivora]MCP1726400.1 biopolymer transport protein TolR [Natronospira proteinivora]